MSWVWGWLFFQWFFQVMGFIEFFSVWQLFIYIYDVGFSYVVEGWGQKKKWVEGLLGIQVGVWLFGSFVSEQVEDSQVGEFFQEYVYCLRGQKYRSLQQEGGLFLIKFFKYDFFLNKSLDIFVTLYIYNFNR